MEQLAIKMDDRRRSLMYSGNQTEAVVYQKMRDNVRGLVIALKAVFTEDEEERKMKEINEALGSTGQRRRRNVD